MSSALQSHGLSGKRRTYALKSAAPPRLNMVRIGNVVTVTAASTLGGAVIFYYWFLDGALMRSGTSRTFTLNLADGEQGRIDCVDTLDPNFDPLTAAPAAFPARYTIHWVRSLATDVKEYLVEWRKDEEGTYTTMARIPHDAEAWDYAILSERLDDLTDYIWRVTPVDLAGNLGDPLLITGPIGEGFWKSVV